MHKKTAKILCFILLFLPHAAYAGSITLVWERSKDLDILGYKVYYGTSSRVYGSPIDVGNTTKVTIPNLKNGWTYYFSVTAYNNEGRESRFSNEISGLPRPTALQHVFILLLSD